MGTRHSQHVETKLAFLNVLRRCDDQLVGLFGNLKSRCVDGCGDLITDWGYTDKPDFRIFRDHIIAELIPKVQGGHIRVMLRVPPVDDHVTEYQRRARALTIVDCKEKTDRLPWIEFLVGSEEEADEAVELFRAVASEWAKRG